jgi:hypothetical protein
LSEPAASVEQQAELEPASGTGDTVALVFNRDFTREQFDALTAVFWAFHPGDWPDGETVVFPSGLDITVKVVKNP